MTTEQSDSPTYCPLGIYRFLLAFFVFAAHTVTIYDPFVWLSSRIGPVELANIGVWLFFVISGYIVIRGAYQFYADHPWAFLGNRLLRIYPAYLTSFMFAWLILLLLGRETIDPKVPPAITIAGLGFFDFLLGASVLGVAFNHRAMHPNPPSWTINIELLFYVIASACLVFQRRSPGRELVLMVAAIAALSMWLGPPVAIPMGPVTYDNITGPFKFAPFFIVGASVFMLQRSMWRSLSSWLLFCISILATAGTMIGVQNIFTSPETIGPNVSTQANYIAMASLFVALIVLSSTGFSKWFASFGPRPAIIDRFIGDLTYPLYLCHVPVLALLWIDPSKPRDAMAWVQSLVVCLAVSLLINIAIERPLSGLRDRLRRRRLT